MSASRMCRVEVIVDAGRHAADFFADGSVTVSRAKGDAWQELGTGRFVNGEIIGVLGGAVIDDRVYAALEGALQAWDANPLF